MTKFQEFFVERTHHADHWLPSLEAPRLSGVWPKRRRPSVANTFQCFTRSPRGSEQAALDEKDVAAYLAFAKEHGIHDAPADAPYDADPATDKMNERDFALMVYSEDLARLAEVDGSLYLIRPGSRLDISVEEGLADVADA